MSRRLWRWGALVLGVLIVAGLGLRLVSARKAALPVAPAAPAAVELAAGDVARAVRTELVSALAVSGGLKAVDSAMVKSRVAAELVSLAVREGDRVTAGQLIGRLDDTEVRWRLKQAEDQAAAAQAQLEIAERTLANNKALVDQGFISRTALDTSVSSANGARASLQAAQAAAELARKAVRDTEVKSPIAGLVAQRFVQPGERLAVDARIVEVVDLSRLELEAALAPEDVVAVRVGQAATLQVDGLAAPVAARVVRLNPGTQAGTRAVMVYLQVLPGAAAAALRQGLFARGQIEVGRKGALVVPVSAVRLEQARPYVAVVAGGKAALRPVTLGGRGDVAFAGGVAEPAVEVLTGVAEGEAVLRGSVGAVRDGTLLKLAAP